MGKRVVKQRITVEGTVLRIGYPTINKALMFDALKTTADVRHEAMMHGFKQRLGDAESGKSPAEKYAMAERIIEAFNNGSWELTDRKFDPTLVLEAVARVKKVPLDKIRAAVEARGEEGTELIKEWRSNGAVKAAMLKIQAERAEAAAEDSDEDEIEIPEL